MWQHSAPTCTTQMWDLCVCACVLKSLEHHNLLPRISCGLHAPKELCSPLKIHGLLKLQKGRAKRQKRKEFLEIVDMCFSFVNRNPDMGIPHELFAAGAIELDFWQARLSSWCTGTCISYPSKLFCHHLAQLNPNWIGQRQQQQQWILYWTSCRLMDGKKVSCI